MEITDITDFYYGMDEQRYAHFNKPSNPIHMAFWQKAKIIQETTAIERYEKPSLRPGIEPNDPNGVIDWKMGSHPKQLEFRDKFFERLEQPHLHETVYSTWGANRSGKTVATWGLCLCKYIRDHAVDGSLFWLIAPTDKKSKQGPHKWLWDYLPHTMFPMNRQYIETNGFGDNPILELILPDGRGHCTCVFKTEDQDINQYESDKVDGVAWTEATREMILRPILLRCSDKSGFILIDYLPTHAWHKERLQQNPDYYSMHYWMANNAHNLPTGTIAKKKKELTAEEYALSVEGKNRSGFGAVYSQFISELEPEGHLCKPFKIPDYWPIYLCADWGYINPHAICFCAVSPDETIFVFDEQYDSKMTVPEVANRISEMLWSHRPDGLIAPHTDPEMRKRWINDLLTTPMIIDPATFQRKQDGMGSIAEDFDAYGIPVQKGAHTGSLEEARVDKVRRRFDDNKLIFFSSVKYTIRDHSSWRYKQNKDWKPDPRGRLGDTNNHACDAIKYLVCFEPTFHKAKATVHSPEA